MQLNQPNQQFNYDINSTQLCKHCQLYVPVIQQQLHEEKCLVKNNKSEIIQKKFDQPQNFIQKPFINNGNNQQPILFSQFNQQNEQIGKKEQNFQQNQNFQELKNQNVNQEYRPIQQSYQTTINKNNAPGVFNQNLQQTIQQYQQNNLFKYQSTDSRNQQFQQQQTIQNFQQLGKNQFEGLQFQQSQQDQESQFLQQQQRPSLGQKINAQTIKQNYMQNQPNPIEMIARQTNQQQKFFFTQNNILNNNESNEEQLNHLMNQPQENYCVVCNQNIGINNPLLTLYCSHKIHQDCIAYYMQNNQNCAICNYRE